MQSENQRKADFFLSACSNIKENLQISMKIIDFPHPGHPQNRLKTDVATHFEKCTKKEVK